MIRQAEQQAETAASTLEQARVIGGGNDNWILQSDSGTYTAKKAFGCLVCPEIGDQVLSVRLGPGNATILSILERQKEQKTRLKFGDDVEISSARSIGLFAGERLDAISGKCMHLDSKQVSLHSQNASLVADRLSVSGEEATHAINNVRVLAKTLETVSETSRQVAMNAFRLVSGLDSTSAGEVLQNIKRRFSVQSRQVSMLAEEDARVNAKRVHLG
jgi:hypothetical protein